MLTVSPLSLSFSSLNQIYAELSDTDIKPNLFSWNAKIAYEESNKPLGFDLHVNVGLGWAPVRLEKFSLAILGSTGFHLGTPYEIDCDVRDYNYYEITYTQLYFDYNLGGEILATVFFNRVFGMFADLDFKGVFGAEELYAKDSKGGKSKPSSFVITGFTFLPTVGFVFTY